MNRRRLLATAASAGAALLGGCSLRVGPNDPGPLDGEWVLQGRVRNTDDQPREWRVESRSEDRESVAAAFGTLPGGESTGLALSGQLFDEEREVFAESETGAQGIPWYPADCRQLFVEVTISAGAPGVETECREQ